MGALGAAVVGWVAIRQRGTYFVMLTLAFAQMFYFVAYTASGLTGGDNGLLDVPRPAFMNLNGFQVAFRPDNRNGSSFGDITMLGSGGKFAQ